jgi:hypothetical protein
MATPESGRDPSPLVIRAQILSTIENDRAQNAGAADGIRDGPQ